MELLWKFSSSSGAIHSRLRVSGSTDLQPPLDQIIDEGTVKRVPRGLRSFTFVCSVHIINQQDKYLYNYFDLHRIYKLHPSNDRMLGLMFIISKLLYQNERSVIQHLIVTDLPTCVLRKNKMAGSTSGQT